MEQEQASFDIVFRGDIVMGHSLEDVKLRLQQLFKADAAKIDALFNGRPVPLKRNLDEATARKYHAVLQKAGAEVSVKPAGGNTAAPKAPRPATGRRQLTLAPVGVNLLKLSERKATVNTPVDITGLTLRPNNGPLLDASEASAEPTPVVEIPDLDLADTGAQLLSEGERNTIPLPIVEPEDWGLADVGADLLKPEEVTQVAVAEIKTLEVDLAPVGSDMGQEKTDITPVAPDISKLKLQDS
ncbi:hypothetical protein KO507_10145 [Gilvimarinus agarilyticus]|uniref:hypothetical protein n=1 Tax=unclassified Gilvimarinus TaxID=2642066 RepID=UPI001C083DD4|nr:MULTISPECIES: hypothetical protein [unclassified Gilvimarinus]MBU2886121.1 hypothetical protein [Gilvimarinus agarilyticus]MDO6570831.1 hypothetical protein [Gilvimarinus sp. 2_MG-2023]MDO6746999.1 hypothetical protein [Gilvimarinus sp. 1_MG-2023]